MMEPKGTNNNHVDMMETPRGDYIMEHSLSAENERRDA
jgi:hypothetical protein